MKRINLSTVSPSNGFPFRGGSITFLQDSYKEVAEDLVKQKIGLLYNSGNTYILYGCKKSSTGGNTTISDGAIFHNGEVFRVSSVTFADPTGLNVVIGTLTITQDALDPTNMSGAGNTNVHDIRKFVFSAGASGSGTKNYSDIINLEDWNDSTSLVANTSLNGTIQGSITASGGMIITNRFKTDGKTLVWNLQLRNFTTSGTFNEIGFYIPTQLANLNLSPKNNYGFTLGLFGKNTVIKIENHQSFVAGGYVLCKKLDDSNFSTGTANQHLDFTITLELTY